MSREAVIERTTSETSIRTRLNLDGTGVSNLHSGIPFFDHMLTLFARHGLFDLDLDAKARGEKKGIRRYGFAYVPMDEALVRAVIDLSGRPYLVYEPPSPVEAIGGNFSFQLVEEFLRAI